MRPHPPLDRAPHLLLVEDSDADRLVVEAMLQRVYGERGLHVSRVADATAACRALCRDGDPDLDLVLLDLTLPDSGGLDTVRRVAEDAGNVPIVVLTASDDEALGLACIEAGAQDYLPKGDLRMPVLGRVIGYAIARSRESAARRRLEQELLEVSEGERQRIAHDLHDVLGQQLTGIAMLARSLAGKLSADGREESREAAELGELAQDAIAQTVALARGLDPLADCGEDLPTALAGLARASERRLKIRCRVVRRGVVPDLSGPIASHLYRIVQEALTNAVRHGGARGVEIGIRGGDGCLALEVVDDGKGAPEPIVAGQGLRIMHYRAAAIGASLEVGPDPGGSGLRVRCVLPDA